MVYSSIVLEVAPTITLSLIILRKKMINMGYFYDMITMIMLSLTIQRVKTPNMVFVCKPAMM